MSKPGSSLRAVPLHSSKLIVLKSCVDLRSAIPPAVDQRPPHVNLPFGLEPEPLKANDRSNSKIVDEICKNMQIGWVQGCDGGAGGEEEVRSEHEGESGSEVHGPCP